MTPRTLALATLALALGAPPAAAAELRFVHERHLEFVGRLVPPLTGDTRCRACHAAEDPVPAVRRAFCSTCHEAFVPAYAPSPLVRPRPGAAPSPVPFGHAAHAASPALACGACHRPAAGSISLTADRDCVGCHARGQVDRRPCAACHPADVKGTRPADHRDGWLRGHGEEAAHAEGRHGRDCATCHGADACARCHREREPRDHGPVFKVRLHGTAAAWGRERCAACHEGGACARCHATTRPQNHGAAWRSVHMLAAGAVGNESCAACHARSFCTSCHLGAR